MQNAKLLILSSIVLVVIVACASLQPSVQALPPSSTQNGSSEPDNQSSAPPARWNLSPITTENASAVAMIGELRAPTAPKYDVKDVAVSKDGATLVVGFLDKVQIWKLPQGQLDSELIYNDLAEGVLALHPNGAELAAARGDLIDVWDLRKHEVVRSIRSPGYVRSLAFLKDGRILAIATDSQVVLLDYTARSQIRLFPIQHTGSSVATNLQESLLAFPSRSDGTGTLVLYDADLDRIVREFGNADNIGAIAINSRGDLVATEQDGRMAIWSATAGKQVFKVNADADATDLVEALAFSTVDPSLLAAFSGQGWLHLWNVDSALEVLKTKTGSNMNGSSYGGNWVALSPDGRLLLTPNGDGSIELWGVPK